MTDLAARVVPQSPDEAFLLEVLEHVRAGRVSAVLVIADDPSGKSLIAGPGLERQMQGLDLLMSARKRDVEAPKPKSILMPGQRGVMQ